MSQQKRMVHFLNPQHWLRLLIMIVFFMVQHIVRWLIGMIALIQFVLTLVTGSLNANLVSFASSLSTYGYQIMLFLTYVKDDKPFPFSPWPAD
jgi:hypothetical protein